MIVKFINRNRKRPRIARFLRLMNTTKILLPTLGNVGRQVGQVYARAWEG